MRAQIDKPHAELLWATIQYRDELLRTMTQLGTLATDEAIAAAAVITRGGGKHAASA